MNLREQKKHRIRERILQVCEAEFRSRGFDETTVDHVLREVEISRQTFFNYFPSKEAVLTEIGLRWIASQAESPRRGAQVAPRKKGAILAGTREATRMQLRAIQGDREFARLLFTRSGLFFGQGRQAEGPAGEPVSDRTRLMFDAVAAVLRVAQEAGELRSDVDPLQAAEIYVSVMLTTARFWLTDYWSNDDDLEARGMRAVDMLLRGIATPKAKPATRGKRAT